LRQQFSVNHIRNPMTILYFADQVYGQFEIVLEGIHLKSQCWQEIVYFVAKVQL